MRNCTIVVINLILGVCVAQAQVLHPVFKDTVVVAHGPYTHVDNMPSLPGDQNLRDAQKEDRIRAAVQKNLVYPANFDVLDKSAKVYVRFMVGQDGQITDITALPAFNKKLSGTCLEAAAAAVKALKFLNPGFHKGRAVPVGITTGIEFGKLAN